MLNKIVDTFSDVIHTGSVGNRLYSYIDGLRGHKDGIITWDDFVPFLAQAGWGYAQAQSAWNQADLNHNGTLTRGEFLRWASLPEVAPYLQQLELTFTGATGSGALGVNIPADRVHSFGHNNLPNAVNGGPYAVNSGQGSQVCHQHVCRHCGIVVNESSGSRQTPRPVYAPAAEVGAGSVVGAGLVNQSSLQGAEVAPVPTQQTALMDRSVHAGALPSGAVASGTVPAPVGGYGVPQPTGSATHLPGGVMSKPQASTSAPVQSHVQTTSTAPPPIGSSAIPLPPVNAPLDANGVPVNSNIPSLIAHSKGADAETQERVALEDNASLGSNWSANDMTNSAAIAQSAQPAQFAQPATQPLAAEPTQPLAAEPTQQHTAFSEHTSRPAEVNVGGDAIVSSALSAYRDGLSESAPSDLPSPEVLARSSDDSLASSMKNVDLDAANEPAAEMPGTFGLTSPKDTNTGSFGRVVVDDDKRTSSDLTGTRVADSDLDRAQREDAEPARKMYI